MEYRPTTALKSRRQKELDYLHTIRSHELQLLLEKFGQGFRQGRVLEIGSGTGQQLRLLKSLGIDIVGVEIEAGWYDDCLLEEITKFDGMHLPFPDNTFELVFSSNVMEHVQNLQALQVEIARVLKPTGVALHVMPSSSWRIWAIFTHYITLPTRLWSWCLKVRQDQGSIANQINPASHTSATNSHRALYRKILALLFPEKHGVFGNRFTEAHEFGQVAWKRRFVKADWRTIQVEPIRLFYTSSHLLNHALSLTTRNILSHFLGSSSHAYLVRPRRHEDGQ